MIELKEFILSNCFTINDKCRSDINNLEWWSKRNVIRYYEAILRLTSFLPINAKWSERIYCILTDIDEQSRKKCKCGTLAKWDATHARYKYYCSNKCASLYTVKKREDYFLSKYGVTNAAKTDMVKQKILKSFEKYENGHPLRDSTVLDKLHKTCNKNYGANTPLESPVVLEKISISIKNKYGVDKPLQYKPSLQKQINTTYEKYGVVNYNQRHLNDKTLIAKQQLTKESKIEEFFDLGYSTSHTYKILKSKGIKLEKKRSLGEEQIQSFLEDKLGRTLISNTKISNVEVDIFDDHQLIGIEYNGVYWHSERKKPNKNFHLNKTNSMLENNIKLIHLFSTEWDEKKDIVKSKLQNIFSCADNIIQSCNCEFKKMSKYEEIIFFNKTNINGYKESSVSYGLYNNSVLIAAMSFLQNKEYNSWEILRHSTELGFMVINYIDTIISNFRNIYNNDIIISIDRRWENISDYKKIGFTVVKEIDPQYFYTKDNKLIIADYVLSNDDNYYKIWDCGKVLLKLS
jgi:hypothetical protein